jgi:hypothetical protein
MGQEGSLPAISGERVIASYCVSVTAGTATFVVAALLSRVTGFESATNLPLWHKAVDLMVTAVLMFVMSWMVGMVAAAIPCALLAVTAWAFKIRNWIFYVVTGIALGLLMVRVYVGFFNSFHWYTDPPDETARTWFQGILTVGRFLAPAGGVAGLTFWKLAGRYYR